MRCACAYVAARRMLLENSSPPSSPESDGNTQPAGDLCQPSDAESESWWDWTEGRHGCDAEARGNDGTVMLGMSGSELREDARP